MTDLLDRVRPHDAVAEAAILGSCMIDRRAVELAVDEVRPEDFYGGAHRKIFEAIIELFVKDVHPDLIALGDRLTARGDLDAVGGAARLREITDGVPSSSNVEHYAGIVRRHAQVRRFIQVAIRAVESAFEPEAAIETLCERMETAVARILDREPEREIVHQKHVAAAVIDRDERESKVPPLQTEYPGLDRLVSLRPRFVVVGARPSIGKSSFLLNLACRMAGRQGSHLGYFSLETDAEDNLEVMVAAHGRMDMSRRRTMRAELDPAELSRFYGILGDISSWPIWWDDRAMHVDSIVRIARIMKRYHAVEAIFVDYYQLIEESHRERREALGEVSKKLKRLQRQLGIPLFLAVQLNKSVEGRPDKRPTASDFYGCDEPYHDCDTALLIHRPKHYEQVADPHEAEVIVAKNRGGPVGKVPLVFFPRETRFEEEFDTGAREGEEELAF